jgi:hypothetical protein
MNPAAPLLYKEIRVHPTKLLLNFALLTSEKKTRLVLEYLVVGLQHIEAASVGRMPALAGLSPSISCGLSACRRGGSHRLSA